MTITVDEAFTRGQAYRSDQRPDFTPFEKRSGAVKGFTFAGDLGTELARGNADRRRRRSTSSTTCSPSASWRR